MNNNHLLWNKLTEEEQKHLAGLLLRRKRGEAITYVLGIDRLHIEDAINFIDNTWLRQKIIDFDPTRLSAKDEFKSKILRVLTDAKYYIDDTEMKVEEKYEFITANHIVELFEICREE